MSSALESRETKVCERGQDIQKIGGIRKVAFGTALWTDLSDVGE